MAEGARLSTENDKPKSSLQRLSNEFNMKTNQTFTEQNEGRAHNSEELRRSVRSHKLKRSFTPEPTDRQSSSSKTPAYKYLRKDKTNKLSRSTATGSDRPYDRLANGMPFSCDLCGSPYVCNPLTKRASKFKRSRHMPSPRQKIDPISGKVLVLCNACGLAFDQPRVKKEKIAPSVEKKEEYLKSARLFASALHDRLKEPEAERLYCPSFKMKSCGCLQSYIIADGNEENSQKRALELISLVREARRLSSLKCYSLDDNEEDDKKQRKSKNIGLGNGQKRSKEFEEFVMSKRLYLRNTMKLCERATQKVLVYSNNFLHKKLKTEERGRRAVRVKGKAAMGMLKPLCELAKDRCCVDNCVMMVFSHKRLLQHWRDSAKLGQLEARRVLAEMLTPSGGARTNCYKFISWVTGCSNSTISKVSDQMKRTGGEREPPLHGMKKYWQTKQKKSQECQTQGSTENSHMSTVSQQITQVLPNQVIAAPATDTGQTGVKIVSVTQFEQQLLQLQQQLVEHQIQLQQQHRLVQQQLLQQALAHAEKSQILNQLSQLQSVQVSHPQNTLTGLPLQQNTSIGMLVPKNTSGIISTQQNIPSGISIQPNTSGIPVHQNSTVGLPIQQNTPVGISVQQNAPTGVQLQQNIPMGISVQHNSSGALMQQNIPAVIPVHQSTSETRIVQENELRERLVQRKATEGIVQINLPGEVHIRFPNSQTTSTNQLEKLHSNRPLSAETQFQGEIIKTVYQNKPNGQTITGRQKQHIDLKEQTGNVKSLPATLSYSSHISDKVPAEFLSQIHAPVVAEPAPETNQQHGYKEHANIQHTEDTLNGELLNSKPQENSKTPKQTMNIGKITQHNIQNRSPDKGIIADRSQQYMKNINVAVHDKGDNAEMPWQLVLNDSLIQTKQGSEVLHLRNPPENMFNNETGNQGNQRLLENLSVNPKILLTGSEKSAAVDQILSRQFNLSDEEPKEYISHKQLRYQKLRQLDQWKQQRSKIIAETAADNSGSSKLEMNLTKNEWVQKQKEKQTHVQNSRTQKFIPGNAVTTLRKIAPRADTSTPVTFQFMQVEPVQINSPESELLSVHSNASNSQLSYIADGIQELTQGGVSDPSKNILPIQLSQSLQNLSPVKNVGGSQVGSIHIYNMPIQPFQTNHAPNEFHNGDESHLLVRPADDSSSSLNSQDVAVSMPGLNITLMSQGAVSQTRDTTMLESTDGRQMLLPMPSSSVPNMNCAVLVPDDSIDKISPVPNSSINLIPIACASSSMVYSAPENDRYRGLPVLSNMSESSIPPIDNSCRNSTIENPSPNSEVQTITIDGMSLSPEIMQSLAQGYAVTLQSGDKQMSLMKR